MGAVHCELKIPLFNESDAVRLACSGSALGIAKAWITVWRTDHLEDADTAPGDFSAPNDVSLASEGIFSLTFTNAHNERLAMPNYCQLTVKQSALMLNLPGLGNPLLWGFNVDKGLWEVNSVLQSNQNDLTVVLAGDPHSGDFGIGIAWDDSCSIKVKTLKNPFSLQPVSGVQVRIRQYIRVTGDSGPLMWVSSNSGYTGVSGKCLKVLCCKGPNACGTIEMIGDVMAVDIRESLEGYIVDNGGIPDAVE